MNIETWKVKKRQLASSHMTLQKLLKYYMYKLKYFLNYFSFDDL